ncbi:MAG TPA: molybdate ABC transporter substrate-binding protein [Jatrophihabitans sp.]|nr:molybdate ABC transporter substrate-binding protein [Jatrophihabitans sp.]
MSRAGCLLAATALVVLAGCGSAKPAGQPTGGAAAGGSAAPISGTITVLAASSLTEAFGTLAKRFEAAHPGVTVKLSFGASSALALQIDQGAPADVFASASAKNMTQVVSAGGAGASTNFVKNVMQIAVPPANPAHIATLADLARSGVKVALCQPQVPCGATAQQVFDNAGLKVRPVTLEADVRSTLTKVETDEVDAGVVYLTDVRAAGNRVTGIPIDSSVNASTEYPIAALTRSPNPAGAAAFVAYVLSAAGRQVFSADGFEQP